MQEHEETIVVIGAGVIGLTTALHIQSTLPRPSKQSVLLIAKDFPNSTSLNYASPWAGAHYRPVPAPPHQTQSQSQSQSPTNQHVLEEARAKRTYASFKRIATSSPGSGIEWINGIEHLEAPEPAYLDEDSVRAAYAHLEGWRLLGESEVPAGVKWGAEYRTFVVNSPVYCAWLMRQFVLRGGRTMEYALADVREAFYLARGVRTVVNCSGSGFGDEKSYIVRGQTCLVRNPCTVTLTRQNSDGSWSFCIPRPLGGGTVIGGTKQAHDWDPRPSLATRERLLANAAKWFPFAQGESTFDVIGDIVGRRPAREGGMRIEAERIDADRVVVHAYGAGGRGFELSWGVAEDVLAIMREKGLVLGTERASL